MLPPFNPWLTSVVAADVVAASSAGDDALAARQHRRLGALLAAAATTSPMYRELLAGRDAAKLALADLPIVRKAELMRRFHEWVADPAIRLDDLRRFVADPARIGAPFLGRYVAWESSGSSGEPAVFVQDAAAMATYDALEAIRRPASAAVRSDAGSMGRDGAARVRRRHRRTFRQHGVDRAAASAEPVAFVASAQHLVPAAGRRAWSRSCTEARRPWSRPIRVPPSCWRRSASRVGSGSLRKEIWTGGETLSPAMRAFVQQGIRLSRHQQLRDLGISLARERMQPRLAAPQQRLGDSRTRGRARKSGAARNSGRDHLAHQPRQPRPAADPVRHRRPRRPASGSLRLRLPPSGDRRGRARVTTRCCSGRPAGAG